MGVSICCKLYMRGQTGARKGMAMVDIAATPPDKRLGHKRQGRKPERA
jgi:hypothetical protein